MWCLLPPLRPPTSKRTLIDRIISSVRTHTDEHTPPWYHLSSKTQHNACLFHWLVLHLLPRAVQQALITTLCFVSMVSGIEELWTSQIPCFVAGLVPSSQWLTVLRWLKASRFCRNWPHSCRSWPGYVFLNPLPFPTSFISTHFAIPSLCWHVWAYLPPLCNISL